VGFAGGQVRGGHQVFESPERLGGEAGGAQGGSGPAVAAMSCAGRGRCPGYGDGDGPAFGAGVEYIALATVGGRDAADYLAGFPGAPW
jgi:hypothetical protein